MVRTPVRAFWNTLVYITNKYRTNSNTKRFFQNIFIKLKPLYYIDTQSKTVLKNSLKQLKQ